MLSNVPTERRNPHQTRLCRARREQAFMEEHGGWAPRMVFVIFSALGCLPGFMALVCRKALSTLRCMQEQEFLSWR